MNRVSWAAPMVGCAGTPMFGPENAKLSPSFVVGPRSSLARGRRQLVFTLFTGTIVGG